MTQIKQFFFDRVENILGKDNAAFHLLQQQRMLIEMELRCHCAFTMTMEITSRCLNGASCTITAFLLRFFYDFTPILVGHDPTTFFLSMFKVSVARA